MTLKMGLGNASSGQAFEATTDFHVRRHMIHWLWDIAKRHPTRALMFGGLALLAGVAVHGILLQESADPHSLSPAVLDLAILAAGTDGVCALAAFVMVVVACWRICRGKP
jgi:hypothetical protein